MAILGRKRTHKPAEASPDGLALLQCQLASPDPVLCRVAEEAAECQKAAPSTVIPFRRPSCRYCGRISAFGWADLICERCERVRTKIEAGAMSKFSIAERRGWRGPPTIADDELLVVFTRRLRDADKHRVELDEKDERRARRVGKGTAWYSDTKPGAGGHYKPQRSLTSGAEATPEFATAG